MIEVITILTALFLAYVAWQQWQVNRNKLRLDLFDRRYKVLDATRAFVQTIVEDATFTNSNLNSFVSSTSDSIFLFKSDVVNYLNELRQHALEMRRHRTAFEQLPSSDERTKHVQEESRHLAWICEQTTGMSEVFARYLDFSHIQGKCF